MVAGLFDLSPWGISSVVSNDREAMQQATEHLLGLGHRRFLYISGPDDSAISFVKTVTRAGVRVPEDISVIGFDGSRVGAFTSPGLASIRQMTDEIGRSAASLLLRLLANPRSGEPQRVVVPCDLLTRESIAPPAEAKAAETEVLPGHRRAVPASRSTSLPRL